MLISSTKDRPGALEDLIDPALLARLERLDVRTLKMFPGKLQGERRSKKRGQSVEFADYRNYARGDDLRFIDWNAYARLERLFIKVFLEEEDIAVHIALDASASMDTGRPGKLAFASRLAMALGYLGLVNQNRVGLTVFGMPGMPEPARLPDARGRHHVQRLGQFIIDNVWAPKSGKAVTGGEAGPRADFNHALSSLARMRVGKGVMVVVSDFLIPDGYEPGLRALAAAGGYDTYCIQVLSPGEVEPDKEQTAGGIGLAGDVRLQDIETGRSAEVTLTSALIKRYKERLDAYCETLTSYCLSREMAHVLVRSDADLASFVLETLRRRGMVG